MNFDQYFARAMINGARQQRLNGHRKFAIKLQHSAMVHRCRARSALPRQGDMFSVLREIRRSV